MDKGAEVAGLEQWKKHHFRLKVEVGPVDAGQMEEMTVKSAMRESEHQHFLARTSKLQFAHLGNGDKDWISSLRLE